MTSRLCSLCRGTGSVRVLPAGQAAGFSVVAWATMVPTTIAIRIVDEWDGVTSVEACPGCVVRGGREAKSYEGRTIVRVSKAEADIARLAVKPQKIRAARKQAERPGQLKLV